MSGHVDSTTSRTTRGRAARDGEAIPVYAGEAQSNDQDWLVSWHRPAIPPDGIPSGASGICATEDGGVVLISEDGEDWDLPGGHPEGNETWEETLRREVREEACATVVRARLLGFARSACIAGPQAGQVLIRSMWHADVILMPWEPQFEMTQRRIVPAAEVIHHIVAADGIARIVRRALCEAGVITDGSGSIHVAD